MREQLRALERRLYSAVLHRDASDLSGMEPRPWAAAALAGHQFCLLVSFRRDGRGVSTPVWFATDGERIVARSGATDRKVKRIRREPRVLVAPCTFTGRPLGPPMEGLARLLTEPAQQAAAEDALRRRLGLPRRLYSLVRDPSLEAAYLEIRGA